MKPNPSFFLHQDVFRTLQHDQVDGVPVFGAGSENCAAEHLLAAASPDNIRLSHGEPVLGKCTGLVGAEDVHSRQFLDG